jgi:rare lipoprotein A
MARRLALAAALLAGIAGCAPPPAGPPPRYMVGQPYQMGGTWSYPRESFDLVETGLATTIADTRAGRRTANGETYDPGALLAAHRTLQLPAVVRVTNLENGLQLDVRVNDRGPAEPGRVLALSRRAAQLLGVTSPAQIRLAVVADASRALAGNLPSPELPRLDIAAAPVAAVQREDLAPPPGAAQARNVREARPMPGGRAEAVQAAAPMQVPDRLPETVTRGPARPGRLYVETASFSRRDLAERQAARIRGRVEATGPRGRQTFRVRIGPLGSVAEADRALENTLRAGVSEARIVVE